MQTIESVNAKLAVIDNQYRLNNQFGQNATFGNGKLGMATGGQEMTRDDIIANFAKPMVNFGKEGGTRWDLIKNSPFGSTWDMWGIGKFDNYEDWKNWFMQEHPENEVLQVVQPMGGQITLPTKPSQPTTTTPTQPSLTGYPQPPTASNLQPTQIAWQSSVKPPTASIQPMTRVMPNISNLFNQGSQNQLSGMTSGWGNQFYEAWQNNNKPKMFGF